MHRISETARTTGNRPCTIPQDAPVSRRLKQLAVDIKVLAQRVPDQADSEELTAKANQVFCEADRVVDLENQLPLV